MFDWCVLKLYTTWTQLLWHKMNSQNQTSRWNICSKNMLLVGKASRDREINKSQFPTKMKQSSGAVFAHTPHQYVDRFLEILSFWKKSLALSMLGHIFWSCHAYCTWRFWNTLSQLHTYGVPDSSINTLEAHWAEVMSCIGSCFVIQWGKTAQASLPHKTTFYRPYSGTTIWGHVELENIVKCEIA